uniref:Uncharacterized protein n=1 Tax=Setaria digitata TaxID=48799 RepID=A0A915PJ15_9BILA
MLEVLSSELPTTEAPVLSAKRISGIWTEVGRNGAGRQLPRYFSHASKEQYLPVITVAVSDRPRRCDRTNEVALAASRILLSRTETEQLHHFSFSDLQNTYRILQMSTLEFKC